ncbi:hypothetical protein F4808DRAFT_92314 [Astrocystis sublimbata]|nr:hypothetical protein F4808DRAFT_92314 [Astrocystis sublimbata]
MGFFSFGKSKNNPTSDLPETYTFSSESLTATTMSTASYSSSGSRPTSRHYNTGFPDSFAACTTSMRHPDAIIDPSFAISAEHIDPEKTLQRSRKSLLRKHRRTISHGKITEDTFAREFAETLALGDDDVNGVVGNQAQDASVAMSPKRPAETASQAKDHETTLGSSADFRDIDNEQHDNDERRRNHIFRKLMNNN